MRGSYWLVRKTLINRLWKEKKDIWRTKKVKRNKREKKENEIVHFFKKLC